MQQIQGDIELASPNERAMVIFPLAVHCCSRRPVLKSGTIITWVIFSTVLNGAPESDSLVVLTVSFRPSKPGSIILLGTNLKFSP